MPNPRVGDLFRVAQHNGELLSGQVTRVDSAEFLLREQRTGRVTTLRQDSVSSYQRGIKAPRGRWAMRGARIGAGFPLLSSGISIYYDTRPTDRTVPASIFVIPMSLGSPVIGAGIGAVVAPVRWQPDVRVSSQPGARGMGIGLRRSFCDAAFTDASSSLTLLQRAPSRELSRSRHRQLRSRTLTP